MAKTLSPKQVAQAMGVSEASLKRWCDKGVLPIVRTAGGHRRIALEDVIQYLRKHGLPVVRPEVLGLPASTGRGTQGLERIASEVREALEAGDEERVRGQIFNLYFARHSICEICDRVLAPAFVNIGTRWEHGQVEVYQERRACEIVLRTLYELRQTLPPLPEGAPVAFGGTLAGDPYQIPTTMVDLVLRESGWAAESFGTMHPVDTLCAAMKDLRPRMLWVSSSAVADQETFASGLRKLAARARVQGTALAIGGRGITEDLRTSLPEVFFCSTLHHLVTFGTTVRAA